VKEVKLTKEELGGQEAKKIIPSRSLGERVFPRPPPAADNRR
jgi:hypothetical protein